jgi:lysophospholipid acyltransferase (LPLAT)-like uncharacterized protein
MSKAEKGQKLWFRLVLFIVPRLVSYYFRIVDLTSRTIFLNTEYEDQVCKRMPFACACFHGTMLFPVYYCRRYPGVVMVSRSHDGEIIDRSIRRMGYDTVRGSSSKGGKEALAEMIEQIRERNYCSGLAVDAPRGPSRKVKMGIVIVGRETGQPVVPLVSWATRQIQFRSWDSMILPLPFSVIVMSFGKPTMVPKGLSPEEYEQIRLDIETEMLKVSAETERMVAQIKKTGVQK